MSTLVKVYTVAPITDASGRPIVGAQVTFVPSVFAWHDTVLDSVASGRPVSVCTDIGGVFSVELQATDDTGITPHGWSYTVAVEVRGVIRQVKQDVAIPAADATSGIDFATLYP